MSVPRLLPGTPPELIVYDRQQRCPYLRDRVARMTLRLPARPLDRRELDARLTAGDRRQGYVLYRMACPSCRACEPIRLNVGEFEFGRTHKRILRRGDRALRVELGPPVVDARRIALYNAHKQSRGLSEGQPAIDAEGYRDFLVSTCCDSFELRYRAGQRLVGVAVVDRSANALSAVYCYYDPEYEGLSVGTYSIIKQIELSRRWQLRHLYLGLYIGECEAMAYKARFLPHERLLDGRWMRFDRVAPAVARRAG